MAIRSGFFNSVNGDRKYDARRFAEYFASFIGNGVFPNPSTNLQVVAQTIPDMTVIVRPGKAWINGYILINDDDYILQLEPADGVLNRIDRVVARYDTADREIRLEVKKGTFASTPVAPALQRDVDAYELALADIYVANGVISITQANITDQRLNSELCGIVHGTVEQVDTTTLATQYQTWFSETQTGAETDIDDLMGDLQSDWDTWFATVQEVLDGDTAGNLLNLINANSAAIAAQADDLDAHLADTATDAHTPKNVGIDIQSVGDLIVGTGANATGRIAIGNAGEYLKVNSAGDGYEFGAGGAWEVIAKVVLNDITQRIEFIIPNPEEYLALKIYFMCKRAINVAGDISITFNKDWTRNYYEGDTLLAEGVFPKLISGAGANNQSNSLGEILFSCPSDAGRKIFMARFIRDFQGDIQTYRASWNNSLAINEIGLGISDGFAVGSTFVLLGVKK